MNFVKILVVSIVTIVIAYFSYRIVSKINKDRSVAKNTATLPPFNFLKIDNWPFTKQDIVDTLGKVIIELFSPDCEHCQYMAKALVANRDNFLDAEIIMVTPFGDSATVAKFVEKYQLNLLPKGHFLLDTRLDFPKIFGTSIVPSFFIYKNNKLVKSIKGETKVENLLD